MADKQSNDFKDIMESLVAGMGSVFSSKTVVGQAQTLGDVVIVPLVDVTVGAGAGSSITDKKGGGAGGFSAKMSPAAVLVIKDGLTRVINIKGQDAVTKAMDLVPELVNKFMSKRDKDMPEDKEAVDIAFPEDDE